METRFYYYGPNDLSLLYTGPRAIEVLKSIQDEISGLGINDILELVHILKYLKLDVEAIRENWGDRIRDVEKQVNKVIDINIANMGLDRYIQSAHEVESEYRKEYLVYFIKYFRDCGLSISDLCQILLQAKFGFQDLLSCRRFVSMCNYELTKIIESSNNADEILARLLLNGDGGKIYRPESLTSEKLSKIWVRYVKSNSVSTDCLLNIIYNKDSTLGVTPVIKQMAERRYKEIVATTRPNHLEFEYQVNVVLSDELEDVFAVEKLDEGGARWLIKYSLQWFEETLDPCSIMNNFIHLFGFVSSDCILKAPSREANDHFSDKLLGSKGKDIYETNMSYEVESTIRYGQIGLYVEFLKQKQLSLEVVLQEIVNNYFPTEYGNIGFKLMAPTKSASILEKIRHIFAEIDGLIQQYTVFCEVGRVDFELLKYRRGSIRYEDIPSNVDGKYLSLIPNSPLRKYLTAIFSDHSLYSRYFKSMYRRNVIDSSTIIVADYLRLEGHAQKFFDEAISYKIFTLSNDGKVELKYDMARILGRINYFNAIQRYYLSSGEAGCLDLLEDSELLTYRNKLLTKDEVDYFNYRLNNVKFRNSQNIRNMYMHGSIDPSLEEEAHYISYLTSLEILISIVIKINDDLMQSILR